MTCIKRLPLAIKYMFSSDEEDGSGEVSSFAALCTALSATIGTGNIVGVATAVSEDPEHCFDVDGSHSRNRNKVCGMSSGCKV